MFHAETAKAEKSCLESEIMSARRKPDWVTSAHDRGCSCCLGLLRYDGSLRDRSLAFLLAAPQFPALLTYSINVMTLVCVRVFFCRKTFMEIVQMQAISTPVDRWLAVLWVALSGLVCWCCAVAHFGSTALLPVALAVAGTFLGDTRLTSESNPCAIPQCLATLPDPHSCMPCV